MAERNNHGGKEAAMVIGGGIIGAGLTALFQSRPAKAAPESDKLDYVATLLERLITAEADTLAAIKSLSLGGAPVLPGQTEVNVAVTTPWVARDPVIIFDLAIRNAGVFFSDDLADFRNSKRLAVKVESTLNQAVVIQLMGNIDNTWQLAVPIAGPFPCPANGNLLFGLAWDDWRPFIGAQITAGIAPVSGNLRVRQVLQD